MAPSAKGIDVHFVSPGFDVSDTIPAVDNLQYSNYSQYLTGVASSVRVVALDSLTSEVVFDSGVIVLSGDTVYKYVILDRVGGGRPLFGLLIEDKS
jgi:hypothetical protein